MARSAKSQKTPAQLRELYRAVRIEMVWGVVLVATTVALVIYVINQKIIQPGFDPNAHGLDNPFFEGFLWGSFGSLIPGSLFVLVWSGAMRWKLNQLKGTGSIYLYFLIFVAPACFGWYINVMRLQGNSVKQEGWHIGALTLFALIASVKVAGLALLGRPLWRFRGRVGSKRHMRVMDEPFYQSGELKPERPASTVRRTNSASSRPQSRPGNTRGPK